MNEKIKIAADRGEEIAKQYNPETLIPFPFKRMVDSLSDLNVFLLDLSPDLGDVSGATMFEKDKKTFKIIINKNKPKKRQYFTIAHEIGHYFLHKDRLYQLGLVIDYDSILFRLDGGLSSTEETEANHFAASLIMPKEKVKLVWKKTKDPGLCADFFDVSLSAMSIRLEVLKLI